MTQLFLQSLAQCRTATELAQAIVEARLFNHDFSACLIAEVGEDGRIREAGRYGIAGPGPSAEAVPLSDGGLIAQALKESAPSVIADVAEAARNKRIGPSGDIDELITANAFNTLVAMPLRSGGLLNGLIILASVGQAQPDIELAHDYDELQALLTLATRSVAYMQSQASDSAAPVLTPREHAIVSLIAGGLTNKEIGVELNLSFATVKLSISSLFAKLGVSVRQDAADKAKKLGIVAADPLVPDSPR